MAPDQRRAALWAAVALFALLALLPVHTHTHDGLQYVLDLRDGPPSALLRPHHPLWNPLCWLAWKAGGAAVPGLQPLAAMRLVSAAFAALAAWLLLALLLETGRPPRQAWALATVATLCYHPWRYASIPEPYTIFLALVLALCRWAWQSRSASDRDLLLLGAAAGLATLFMQSVFLYVPTLLILALVDRHEPLAPGQARRRAALLCSAFAATAVVGYLAAGWAATAGRPAGSLAGWLSLYAVDQRWWGHGPEKLLLALIAAAWGFFGQGEVPHLTLLAAWAVAAALALLGIIGARKALALHRPLVAAPAVALGLHFLFYYQLDAGSPKYWVNVPALVALLLAAPLEAAAQARPRLVGALLAALVFLGPAAVWFGEILPQSDPERYTPYHEARAVAEVVGSEGVVWTMGGDLEEKVLRVFTSLAVRNLHDSLIPGQDDPDLPLQALRVRLQEDLAGGPVYVLHDLWQGGFKPLIDDRGRTLSPDRIGTVFEGLRLRPLLAARGRGVVLSRTERQ